ncbi:MAG: hypothetical protein ACRC2B_21325 [Rubrivivax sp.]
MHGPIVEFALLLTCAPAGAAFVRLRRCAQANGETGAGARGAFSAELDWRGAAINGCNQRPPDPAQIVVMRHGFRRKLTRIVNLVWARSHCVVMGTVDDGDRGPIELSVIL